MMRKMMKKRSRLKMNFDVSEAYDEGVDEETED
jgi:hypothetical protein